MVRVAASARRSWAHMERASAAAITAQSLPMAIMRAAHGERTQEEIPKVPAQAN